MDIKYKENNKLKLESLVELYENVGWISYSNKPSELNEAVKNSLFNIAAFDDEELIGLIRVIGDNMSILYIQDILVKEKYQRLGIESTLLKLVLNRYRKIKQVVLITDDTEKTKLFYEKNGMVPFQKFKNVGFIKYNL